MPLRFMSFASGSSGNCYYLGIGQQGILVDAGAATRTIRKHLRDAGVAMEEIRAVFITHDHADHIKGVASLGERLHIPIYATEKVHKGISRNYCVKERLYTSARILEKGTPLQIGDFQIEAFEVPHDGTDNVGYCIKADGQVFVFMTDLGSVPTSAEPFVARANYLVLEANYDTEMLRTGTYPPYLKGRISGPRGHLSNTASAEFLATHWHPGLRHVWLCHLSQENNHPDLVLKTFELRLKEAGIHVGQDLLLTPLKRTTPSEMYLLE